ncbi:MAG: HAD hydrolase-like protein [Bacteroidales bacterium]|nr:HAD hydrolase-like protein [Bacteroidales bacterium]
MSTLLFDYGGTLDSAAHHWNYILLDGYRQVTQQIAPELHIVSGEVWRAAYVYAERALAAHPIVQPEDDMLAMLVKKVRIQLQHLVEKGLLSLSAEQIEHSAQAIAQHCDTATRSTIAQSRKILQALQERGYKMLIVSNFYGNLHSVLQGYDLLHLFSAVIESAVVGVRKPDPAIWQLGIDAAGCSAEACTAIGDSYSKDIVPAASLGCRTIWYEGEEWEVRQRDRSLPTHIISHLSQLLELFP